jgi:hypothetical protein
MPKVTWDTSVFHPLWCSRKVPWPKQLIGMPKEPVPLVAASATEPSRIFNGLFQRLPRLIPRRVALPLRGESLLLALLPRLRAY